MPKITPDIAARIHDWRPGDVLKKFGDSRHLRIVHIDGQNVATVFFKNYRSQWDFWGNLNLHDKPYYSLVETKNDDFFWVGVGPVSGRPYVMFKNAAGVVLRAGCRSFTTYAQAARHWRDGGYSDQPAKKRAMAKEAFAEARRRGWLKVKRQPPVKKARAKK